MYMFMLDFEYDKLTIHHIVMALIVVSVSVSCVRSWVHTPAGLYQIPSIIIKMVQSASLLNMQALGEEFGSAA